MKYTYKEMASLAQREIREVFCGDCNVLMKKIADGLFECPRCKKQEDLREG